MDIVRWFSKFPDQIPTSLSNLQLWKIMVTSPMFIYPNESLLSSLSKCATSRYSGIAIVEPESNELIGNLSLSDLRGKSAKDMEEMINWTVENFMKKKLINFCKRVLFTAHQMRALTMP